MSVWNTLSSIDCSQHVETKGGLSYLSWAWAWGMVKAKYPEANYELHQDMNYPDTTLMVSCSVIVEGIRHVMWLPVMDNRNNAIINPNARQISDARMRCLVKAIAMHGLGHYIYAGEDLPYSEPYTPEQLAHFNAVVHNQDGWGMLVLSKALDTSVLDALFNSAPAGKKTALKAECRKIAGEANEHRKAALIGIQRALVEQSLDSITEILAELPSDDARNLVLDGLCATEIEHINTLRNNG